MPPTVSITPKKLTIAQGASIELRCDIQGEPTPTVKWSKLGEELGSHIVAMGPLLVFSNVAVQDRGMYLCTAESPAGTADASAVLEVLRREPPSVTLLPAANQTVSVGDALILACRAVTGDPPPKIQWVRSDGRPLGSHIEQLRDGVLRFNNVQEEDGGVLICHAENEVGKVSARATITVNSAPTLVVLPSTTITITEDQKLRLECRATGRPTPSVIWSRPTYNIPRKA